MVRTFGGKGVKSSVMGEDLKLGILKLRIRLCGVRLYVGFGRTSKPWLESVNIASYKFVCLQVSGVSLGNRACVYDLGVAIEIERDGDDRGCFSWSHTRSEICRR